MNRKATIAPSEPYTSSYCANGLLTYHENAVVATFQPIAAASAPQMLADHRTGTVGTQRYIARNSRNTASHEMRLVTSAHTFQPAIVAPPTAPVPSHAASASNATDNISSTVSPKI